MRHVQIFALMLCCLFQSNAFSKNSDWQGVWRGILDNKPIMLCLDEHGRSAYYFEGKWDSEGNWTEISLSKQKNEWLEIVNGVPGGRWVLNKPDHDNMSGNWHAVESKNALPILLTRIVNSESVNICESDAYIDLLKKNSRKFSQSLSESEDKSNAGLAGEHEKADLSSSEKLTSSSEVGESKALLLAAGGYFTCALLVDGRVKCWGYDNTDRPPLMKPTPAIIAGVSSAAALTVAGNSGCALEKDGSVKCWGDNQFGQLGYLTPKDYINTIYGLMYTYQPSIIARKVEGLREATTVVMSGHSACAIVRSGHVLCWGENKMGQLGDGGMRSRATAIEVKNLSNVISLKMSRFTSCALLRDGLVQCWGSTPMFLPTMIDSKNIPITLAHLLPVKIEGLKDVVEFEIGSTHGCALIKNGEVKCWGRDEYGQLGDALDRDSPETNGTSNKYDKVTAVYAQEWGAEGIENLTGVASIKISGGTTCAELRSGEVACWGLEGFSQALRDSKNKHLAKMRDIHAISIDGESHVCGITQSRSVVCADGAETSMVDEVVMLTSGIAHTCALLSDGGVKCWGANNAGQLGTGNNPYESAMPLSVLGLGVNRPTKQ